jgi:hypothetical protein
VEPRRGDYNIKGIPPPVDEFNSIAGSSGIRRKTALWLCGNDFLLY